MNPYLLPEEHILHLNIAGSLCVDLVCTDCDLEQLVLGYLYNEGLIQAGEGLPTIEISRDHAKANVCLRGLPHLPEAQLRPSGLGGNLLRNGAEYPVRAVVHTYSERYIRSCVQQMTAQSVRYAQTGGMHCSALFDDQQMLSIFEDLGRHNTFDKIAGDCLLRALPTEDTLLITTGRISSDMVRKGAGIGASVIVSYSVPTQRAYELAKAWNITLIGYWNKPKMTIYTVPERIC